MKKYYILLLCLFVSYTNAQVVNISDPALKEKLLTIFVYNEEGVYVRLNSNENDEIELSEALIAYELLLLLNPNVQNLSGIEFFTNLRTLYVFDTQVSYFDASGLVNLEELTIDYSQLQSIHLGGLPNLKLLSLDHNQLSSLDLAGLTSLETLFLINNDFISLDVTPAINLKTLHCESNSLTNLNVSGLTELISLGCTGNNLEDLDVSTLLNLEYLSCGVNNLDNLNLSGLNLRELLCYDNNLSTLDVDGMTNLHVLFCHNNVLETLHLKEIAYNEGEDDLIEFHENTGLELVCASADKIDLFQSIVDSYNYADCSVSECLLSTDDIASANIVYYPNPADDLITIIINNDHQSESLLIYNGLGQIIKKIDNPKKEISIDISAFPKGIYYLEVDTFDKNLKKSRLKLVKK